MTILIDADGCPVVDITLETARRYAVPVILLCDSAHVFAREGAQTVTVSTGADSVDFALVNRVQPGDIVVTQDYGLAAMCLAKQAVPLHQDGFVYHEGNMDALLAARHLAKTIRRRGGRLHGSSKRRPEQDEAYRRLLEEILRTRAEKRFLGEKI